MTELTNVLEKFWKECFNTSASKYDKDSDISHWTERGLERRLQNFLNFSKKFGSNKIILDAGCGPGTYSRILPDNGNFIVSADYSKNMIKTAVKKSNKKNVEYIVADVRFLPFNDNSFDIVLNMGVLQYISDEKEVIKELKRVVKKENCILVLETLNAISLRAIFMNCIAQFMEINGKIKRYNPFYIKKILKNYNFNEIKIEYFYVFPRKLIFLEKIFEKLFIFKLLNKMPFISQSFVIISSR